MQREMKRQQELEEYRRKHGMSDDSDVLKRLQEKEKER